MSESVEVVLVAPEGLSALNGEVSELPLLLPAGDVLALEQEARRRGLTVGQLLRRLVRDFLREPDSERQRGG
jgi:hypothetical protein